MPQVTIEKLVFGGQGLGRMGEKVCFIWGALPGETVDFQITKKKRDFIEGVTTKVIMPSFDRREPKECHYLSCSPWQIMNYAKENEWKKIIAVETYQRVAGVAPDEIALAFDEREYGYRNKIEYSFALTPEGAVSLSFFERGRHFRSPISPCQLATPAINTLAEKILLWIREEKIPIRSLKSLIIRSNRGGETLAALFIKDRLTLKPPLFESSCRGFHIYYSDHRSPASIISDTLFSSGDDFLSEQIDAISVRYGLNSFFQVNTPLFEMALADIKNFVVGEKSIDYFSGVGSIGLPLAAVGKEVTLIELNAEAVNFAKKNIQTNQLKNVQALLSPAEKALEYIIDSATIIVDPPRAGLDKKFVQAIVEKKPRRVIYLSCDLATQARDLKFLATHYKPVFWRLYNFFPRTPHIEGLIVLDPRGI